MSTEPQLPDASAGFDGDTFYVGETNTAYDDVNVTVMVWVRLPAEGAIGPQTVVSTMASDCSAAGRTSHLPLCTFKGNICSVGSLPLHTHLLRCRASFSSHDDMLGIAASLSLLWITLKNEIRIMYAFFELTRPRAVSTYLFNLCVGATLSLVCVAASLIYPSSCLCLLINSWYFLLTFAVGGWSLSVNSPLTADGTLRLQWASPPLQGVQQQVCQHTPRTRSL